MGSSAVDLVTRPHCFTKATVHNPKKNTHSCIFSTCLFSLFVPNKICFSLSPLDGDLCKTQLQASCFFSSKKLLQKKREFLIFFQTPKLFCHCFWEEKSRMKNSIRERRCPERFLFFFVFQNMVARWRSTPGNSVIICTIHY